MARLTREQSQALTREKLLLSASEVVARDGYSGATIERIAEEAGYSKGAFYSNFATKEEIFLQLLERHAGGDVVVAPRFSPETFWDHVEAARPTYFSAVPTIYAMLEARTEREVDTSSLRFVICGAAPMPAELITRFEERFGVPLV